MTFKQFVGDSSTGIIGVIGNIVVPLIITFAFLYFIWGVVDYFFIHGDDKTSRTNGRWFIIWGAVGFVLIFSIWGILKIVLSTLNIYPSA